MRNMKSKWHLPVSLSLALITTSLTLTTQDAIGITSETFSLITHHKNQANHSIKRRTLRAIYSMRTQSWPNGERLTVFVLPDDETLHESFCQKILGVLPHQLRKSWDRLIFSGKAGAPIVVNSVEEMRTRVAETPGAIGYIPENYLNDSIAVVEVK